MNIRTVYVFVDVLDTFDAARGLHIEVTPVLTEQIRVVGYNPAAVYVIVELIVALDGYKLWSVLRSLVLWIAISLHLGLLAIRKWKAFTTFASRLRVGMHAWALRV